MILAALALALSARAVDISGSPVAQAVRADNDWPGVSGPGSAAFSKEGNVLVATFSSDGLAYFTGDTLTVLDTLTTDSYHLSAHINGDIVGTGRSPGKLVLISTDEVSFSVHTTRDISSECAEAFGAVSMETGDLSIFVNCESVICMYDQSGQNPFCTSDSGKGYSSIEIAPDDSFVAAYEFATATLELFSINSGAALTATSTIAINDLGRAVTMSTVNSNFMRFAIVDSQTPGGYMIVGGDRANHKMLVISTGGSLHAEYDLAAIGCTQPENVRTSRDGLGDVVIVCDTSDNVVSTDLEFGSPTIMSSVGVSPTRNTDAEGALVGPRGILVIDNQNNELSLFGSTPGSGGDPVIVDLRGHRFMAGNQVNSNFFLYGSADGADSIVMRTGIHKGVENGYFIQQLTLTRAGCGDLVLSADMGDHNMNVEAPECFNAHMLRGDSGLLVYTMSSGTVVTVMPHTLGTYLTGFLNIKFLEITPAFQDGCHGMLCDETHVDQLMA